MTNTKTNTNLSAALQNYMQWSAVAAQAKAEMDAAKEIITAHMDNMNIDELFIETHAVYWKTVVSNRIDTGSLRKDFPNLATKYTKQTTARRFTVK